MIFLSINTCWKKKWNDKNQFLSLLNALRWKIVNEYNLVKHGFSILLMCSFLKWNSLDFAALIGHVSRHPVFLNLSLHSALPSDEYMQLQAFQLINSTLKNSA